MEKGEILDRVRLRALDVAAGVKEVLRRRAERRYGTMEERRAAYGELYATCDALFATHADKVGTMDRGYMRGSSYQRLILTGFPDAAEVIIDKNLDDQGIFSVDTVRAWMGPHENPVVYDHNVHNVTPNSGTFHTAHYETHYPPNFNPRDDFPYYVDKTTKEHPLAADVALELAQQLGPDVQPMANHILMAGARYESS
ncbi:MAG: hypothetical protein JWS12_297 [Candidatus Saccharibacteria bacterium]|nr:hypothetical protein [Candidatus Saccharibacteria bacterium]